MLKTLNKRSRTLVAQGEAEHHFEDEMLRRRAEINQQYKDKRGCNDMSDLRDLVKNRKDYKKVREQQYKVDSKSVYLNYLKRKYRLP